MGLVPPKKRTKADKEKEKKEKKEKKDDDEKGHGTIGEIIILDDDFPDATVSALNGYDIVRL